MNVAWTLRVFLAQRSRAIARAMADRLKASRHNPRGDASGTLCSDGGLMLLRQVDRRTGLTRAAADAFF